jgi:hypothetical protein
LAASQRAPVLPEPVRADSRLRVARLA